jgi:hypothetical protein
MYLNGWPHRHLKITASLDMQRLKTWRLWTRSPGAWDATQSGKIDVDCNHPCSSELACVCMGPQILRAIGHNSFHIVIRKAAVISLAMMRDIPQIVCCVYTLEYIFQKHCFAVWFQNLESTRLPEFGSPENPWAVTRPRLMGNLNIIKALPQFKNQRSGLLASVQDVEGRSQAQSRLVCPKRIAPGCPQFPTATSVIP